MAADREKGGGGQWGWVCTLLGLSPPGSHGVGHVPLPKTITHVIRPSHAAGQLLINVPPCHFRLGMAEG